MRRTNAKWKALLLCLAISGCVAEQADGVSGASGALAFRGGFATPEDGAGPGGQVLPTGSDDLAYLPAEPAHVECHPPDSVDPSDDVPMEPEPVPGAEVAPDLAAAGRPLYDAATETTTFGLQVLEPVEASSAESGSVHIGSTVIAVREKKTVGGIVTRSGVRSGARAFGDFGYAPREPEENVLDTKGEAVENLEVVKTYQLSGDAVSVDRIRLVRRTDGATLDDLDFTAEVDDCTAEAWARLAEERKTDMVLPSDMPPVRFPPQRGCDFGECVKLRMAWIRAHHSTWIVHRAMAYVSQLDGEHRSAAWKARGAGPDGLRISAEKSSFAYWFGEYDEDRFDAIREAVADLHRIHRTGYTGSRELEISCVDPAEVDLCFNPFTSPAAHHFWKGSVHVCPRFFDGERKLYQNIETIIHEPLHHVFVELGGVRRALKDTWTHWHGDYCASDREWGAQYGPVDAAHLAQYTNDYGDDCNHRGKAVRNNSNYDEMIRRWGGQVWHGTMTTWPAWHTTPQPPSCPLGDEGCQCLEAGSADVPEGDFAMGMVCPDFHGYETTCSATVFGTQSYGVCTSCEGTARPGGCSCTSDDECAPGLGCFGADTHDGGIGHCYEQQPPHWACLADCEKLFNDERAWCRQHHQTGGRCFDSGCTDMKAEECFEDGLVCRGGQCVRECSNKKDCTDLGYPSGTFECIAHACRRAPWL